jgi:hypothetical protein
VAAKEGAKAHYHQFLLKKINIDGKILGIKQKEDTHIL